MTDDVSGSPEVFDLDKLKQLIEMMEQHGLTEISLRRGEEHWRLRRGSQEMTHIVPANAYPAARGANVGQSPVAAAEESKAADASAGTIEIKSPTVGTFYTSPTPDDPPFVSAGSNIGPETIVCIVEAMKVFNQIPAEVSGTIVEILVGNGDPVEFGQALFRVRPD